MNPLVELITNPVAALTFLGWFMLLVTLLILTLAACYRNALTVHKQWHRDRPRQWEYVPPTGFILRVASIPAILWIDAWVVAALIYLVTA